MSNWNIGRELYDLHYGWQPVHKDCVVKDVMEWRYSPNVRDNDPERACARAFSTFLVAVAHSVDRMYTNKMLMIISEPDDDEYWTAAWSYDGIRQGVCKIKEKQ